MKWNGFGSSLGFALGAAAGWPVFALVAGPRIGASAALSLYLVGVAAVYAFGLTADRARGLGAAALTGAIAAAFAAIARAPRRRRARRRDRHRLARSALLHRRSAGRAIAIEVTLLGVGLLLARFLATPGLLGIAVALLRLFLVQSVFVPSAERASNGRERRDGSLRTREAASDGGVGGGSNSNEGKGGATLPTSPRVDFRLLQHRLRRLLLLVRRVAVLAQDALHEDPELGADVLADGPVDGDVGADGLDQLAGDRPQRRRRRGP